jgi:hypothetical protein
VGQNSNGHRLSWPGRAPVLIAIALLVALSAALVRAPAAGALPIGCAASGSVVTCTYTATGSEQTFVVPAGISSVAATAIGAPGANGGTTGGGTVGLAGAGAMASATLSVTAGATLYLEVGGTPTVGTCVFSSCVGGFNGGATTVDGGGGGGGASDVRTVPSASGGTLASRLLVAAGGGGGGRASVGQVGGDGGAAGADGDAGTPNPGGGGGSAGTPTAGGTGGASINGDGSDGAAGQGGASFGGGGGGGGLFGGGGGGKDDTGGAGGAGGGSSFAPGGMVGLSGDPASVTIVYVVPSAPTVPSGVSAVLHGHSATVSWTAPSTTNGAALTAYTVTTVQTPVRSCMVTTPVAGVLPTTCVVTGLADGVSYTFVVTASNSAGTSAASAASAAITVAAAPDPLADTGAQPQGPLLAGIGLLVAGGVLMTLARRRVARFVG